MKQVTKTYTITATPDTLLRFERFMAFLHFNGGHSGCFGMIFDGDGHEKFKVDPEPPYSKDMHLTSTGQSFEVAYDNEYRSYSIDRTTHHYIAKNGVLTKVDPKGKEEISEILEPEEDEDEDELWNEDNIKTRQFF